MNNDRQFTRVDFDIHPGIPRPGETIYVDSTFYLSHASDDFIGGKATVRTVSYGVSGGEDAPFIEVEENPNCSYNWLFLADEQERLKAEFGDATAHPDPDHLPEFNRW